MLQRSPILSPAAYDALYASAGDTWAQEGLRLDQVSVRDYILKSLPEGGRVLDIGCAGGSLLQSLGAQFQTFGVEPSPEAAANAARVGVSVLAASVEGLRSSEPSFDLISAVDVIEHVPDPLHFLRSLLLHLSPGGQIVISTGNSQAPVWRVVGPCYYYSHHFEHISFISPKWCEYAESQGIPYSMIDGEVRHQLAGRPGLRLNGLLRFAARWLLSLLEGSIVMRLPGTAMELGPRVMVGAPGLFRDHMIVAFRARPLDDV